MAGVHLVLVIVSLISAAMGQWLHFTSASLRGSCPRGFLPNKDIMHLSFHFHLPKGRRPLDHTRYAYVYIGSGTLRTKYCRIILNVGECNDEYLDRYDREFCHCIRIIDLATTYDGRAIIPLTPSMNGKMVYIEWKPKVPYLGYQNQETSLRPLNVYGKPFAQLIVNGDAFNITENGCPSLPLTGNTLFYFCVDNLEAPKLSIWFDTENHCSFDARCGFMSMALDKRYANGQFWLAYTDACRRSANITCYIPPDCCDASSLKALTSMLAVVAIGHLLKMSLI